MGKGGFTASRVLADGAGLVVVGLAASCNSKLFIIISPSAKKDAIFAISSHLG